MSLPLLITKLHVPTIRAELVSRPRLTERLNASLDSRLILISAPAGFGKTTLVSQWLASREIRDETRLRVAWLTLDEGDNDEARFLSYLVAALQTIEKHLGQTALSMLQSPEAVTAPPLENVITLLINDLVTLSTQSLLVLDDYHTIHNLEIHKALTFLLENLPPRFHLLIASREDPMLPLHRLRVRGQMAELHAGDLRFTPDEAAIFLEQTMGLSLTPADIASLEKRTEGWVAGLQLAALSLKDVADKKGFIEAFAGDDRHVVDYLIAEVLDTQSPDIQDFLLRTAILDRLSAPLCHAVLLGQAETDTEQATIREILAKLERANLFLVPLDSKREWYRYHHLFGDLLRYRLRERCGIEGMRQLHQRAAAWYAQAGLIDDAIHHSLGAEDWGRATDLVESICADLVGQGQLHKLLDLVAELPDDLVRTHPHLCAYHAWALGLTGQVAAAAARLKDAERALRAVPAALARETRAQIAILRAYDARHRHDLVTATRLLLRALEYLPAGNVRERSTANGNLGFIYLRLGELGKARGAFQEARRQRPASEDTWMDIGVTSYLADTYVVEGQLGRASQLYQEAITQGLGSSGRRVFPPAGHAHAGLGRVLYEQNKVDEARRHLRRALELGEMIGFWGIVLRALGPWAWLEQTQGNSTVAQTLLQRALDLAHQTRSSWGLGHWEAHFAAFQARFWLVQEPPQLVAATRWAERYQQGDPDASSYEQEFAQLTLAQIELAQGHPGQARTRLELLEEAAIAGGRNDSLIRILALRALVQATQGAHDGAAGTLSRALDLAAPEGYFRTFLDEGSGLLQLLRTSRHPYAAQLLQEAETEVSLVHGAAAAPPPLALRPEDALNEREIKVLRLFSVGLTNAEIAQEMFLSPDTIKWYAKNIYRKLDVNRRAQAVARARELGLIP